jgi:hypothetical protein
LSQAKKALKNLVWYFKADEFSPHPLHIFSTPQYLNFAFEKTSKRIFRSFSSSNLGKKFRKYVPKIFVKAKNTSENMFQSIF